MKKKSAILVVDDDFAHRTMLKTLISGWGYEVSEADDGAAAIEAVRRRPFDLILMDIRMVQVSGIEAMEEIRQINPAIPIILMTAYASVETAVEALKKGAYDYLTKPLDFDELRLVLERGLEHTHLKEENLALKERLGLRFDRRNLIGRSEAMTGLLDLVAQVAPSEATVLISGESGTGKEIIAAAIHYNSLRKDGPFVKINCAAITETLLESELFGHEKGAFTGADRRKEGKFRQANGGTILLDEVSEMSLAMQVKLLRVLDVRVITATNRDLVREIAAGHFREDLYYRLNVVTLQVPPLRERREDIPLLAIHFLKEFADKNHKEIKGFSPRALDRMLRYPWPGNVRELMNTVERGVVLTRSDYLDESDLSPVLMENVPGKENHGAAVEEFSLESVEKITILKTLEEVGGNKSEAARRLGITRRTLHQKLRKYGMM
ncbi:MAG: Transcriptional regulatory protein ZraR [Syntrophus sp. PtaU1.Bin208]|nr:MAG: Transcriptional regulatory protein ZraR [Syntrophus sp. PtaU1.Bin208]